MAPPLALPDRDAADDATLARAILAKDPRAARLMWVRFAPLVRRILKRTLSARHEVDDVSQDVFLRVFKRIHTLREPGALKPFVIAITMRTARNEIRRARGWRWVGLFPTAELPERALLVDNRSQQALIHFDRLLGRINEQERTAFVLRYVERMKGAEVAARLGVSEATARRWFTRAWERVTRFAQRDAFLVDYLRALETAPPEPLR